jgi:hypothetical protein
MKSSGDGSEGDLLQARPVRRRDLVGEGGDRVGTAGWGGAFRGRGAGDEGASFSASPGSPSSDGSVPSPLAWGLSLG